MQASLHRLRMDFFCDFCHTDGAACVSTTASFNKEHAARKLLFVPDLSTSIRQHQALMIGNDSLLLTNVCIVTAPGLTLRSMMLPFISLRSCSFAFVARKCNLMTPCQHRADGTDEHSCKLFESPCKAVAPHFQPLVYGAHFHAVKMVLYCN